MRRRTRRKRKRMKRRKKRRKTEVTLLACNVIDPEFFWLEIEERKLTLHAFVLQISTERFTSWYAFLLSIEFVRLRTIRRYFQSFSIHSYFSNIGKYLRFEENTKKVVTDTWFPVKHFLKISKVCNLLKSKLKYKSSRAAAGLQVITLLLSHYVVDFWRKFNENCILYDSIWYSYATETFKQVFVGVLFFVCSDGTRAFCGRSSSDAFSIY